MISIHKEESIVPRQAKAKKRPDGFYQRSITVGRKPDGKLKRKTIYAKTIKELEQKAADYERQLRHGTLSNNEKMTFGELAEVWLRDYKPTISMNTRAGYIRTLNNHLLPELSTYKLKDLKSHHLQAIINRMAENGKAENTMTKVKLAAVQIMQIAMDNDVIYRNVFQKVTVPSVEAIKRRPLTDEEKSLVTRTYAGHRMGVPALLLLYCGLRRGELIALTWGDITIKDKSINVNKGVVFNHNQPHIEKPKTAAGVRTVPIPETIIDALKEYRKGIKSTMVCPSASGSMMSERAFKCAWMSYIHYLNIQAGGRVASRSRAKLSVIDNITPHMFRHTYATILYNAGVDVKSAQRFLGHADISMTLKIYTHLSQQKEQEAIDSLNKHLSQNESGKNFDAVKIQ
jgi:integrase